MKKLIGIFILIAGTMFLNINLDTKSKTEVDLASLIAANVAHSEDFALNHCIFTNVWWDQCAYPPYIPKLYCVPTVLNLSCT